MTHTNEETSRIIEMAWEDRTPFEAIEAQYGLNETAVIIFMRKELQHRSFERWRKRVSGRKTKHLRIRNPSVGRAPLFFFEDKYLKPPIPQIAKVS
jgi:uncharacterized protein (TIGR03643 family)